MIHLYGLEASGNTYKAQLLMSIFGINYEFIEINVKNNQHKTEAYLKLNPRGEFPVLLDDKTVVWDSMAILIYLAKKYQDKKSQYYWYANDAENMAVITQWLTVSNDEIFNNLGKARAMLKFGFKGDLLNCQKKGTEVLKWVNQHLKSRQWLATEQASIADIACYPYIALCEKGGVSLQAYKEIHRWFNNIQQLEGYIGMPELYKV